jgi:ribosomal protein S18 acetylase RimI-like enzyme
MCHIRKAEEQDFQQIVALFQEFALFEKLPEKMTNSVEQMLREKEYFHCYVAVNEENEILAYVTYFFAYYTWIGKSLYMDDLYVRPQYRGKQIGTSLINTLIALAKEEKCHKMRWQVSGWNGPAIAFYRSLGATVDDVESNCDLVF